MATQEIKARFINGILEPMDTLDIEEGSEVRLIVTEINAEDRQPMKKLTGLAFGTWKGVNAEEIRRHIHESRID